MKIGSITYKFTTFKALSRALEVLKARKVDYTGYGIHYLPSGEIDYYYILDSFHFIGNNPKFDIMEILTVEGIPFKFKKRRRHINEKCKHS